MIGYLKERSKDLQRPPLSYYEQAISNLENREGVQFQDLIYEEALKKAGKEGKMVFMDCYTVWCGPCKMMSPILDEISKEYEGKINVYKVNVDKEADLASVFGIRSIPSLLFVPMKKEPSMVQGAMPKNELKKLVDDILLESK